MPNRSDVTHRKVLRPQILTGPDAARVLVDHIINPGKAGPSSTPAARPCDEDADKPTKEWASTKYEPSRLSWSQVRDARTDANVDYELLGHLARRLLFRSRDIATLIRASDLADRWFNRWNQSKYTDWEIAEIMAYTIAAVMTVPEFEQKAWHLMGNLVSQENMKNATLLARKGAIPETGIRVIVARNWQHILAFFGWVRRAVPGMPAVAAPTAPT
jgi:hypothetical protein